jgi:hypothetical protein
MYKSEGEGLIRLTVQSSGINHTHHSESTNKSSKMTAVKILLTVSLASLVSLTVLLSQTIALPVDDTAFAAVRQFDSN